MTLRKDMAIKRLLLKRLLVESGSQDRDHDKVSDTASIETLVSIY
jgi:hypothetical protein